MKKIVAWLLCLVMFMMPCGVASAAESGVSLSNNSFSVSNVRNSSQTVEFSGKNGKYNVFVFGGVGSCSNTGSVLSSLNSLVPKMDLSKIALYLVDIKNNSTTTINDTLTSGKISESIQACSYGLGGAGMVSTYNKCLSAAGVGNGSWTMPLVVVTDNTGKIGYTSTGMISTSELARGIKQTGAALDYDVDMLLLKLQGEVSYTYANDVLDIVNKERAANGLSALKMDEDLLQLAMQRAAECAISFDHTRPNGDKIYAASEKAAGENIAYGQSTPEEAMDGWMNSTGHRANILKSSYTTLGVGNFCINDQWYWVQVFGANTQVKTPEQHKDETKEYTVEASEDTYLLFGKKLPSKDSGTVEAGKTLQLELSVLDILGGDSPVLSYVSVLPKSYIWSSSDTSVAKVDENGVITGVKEGTATITGANLGRKSSVLTYTVAVTAARKPVVPVEKFTWDGKWPSSMEVGEKYQFKVIIEPENATYKTVLWSSTDPSVATVDENGNVTALKVGETTIKADLEGTGRGTWGSLKVKPAAVKVTGITLNKTALTLSKGGSESLTATVAPKDAADKTLKWSSSNTAVAIVDNSGQITAVNVGTATITATAKDGSGKSASCTVTVAVKEEPTPENGWYYRDGKAYWYENGTRQGTYDDPQGVIGDGTVRGREIYDPASDGWYWLDSVYDGAKACSKEVWMPYIYQNEKGFDDAEIAANAANSGDMAAQVTKAIKEGSGKWVRYDANGKMYKGWYTVQGADAKLYPDQAGNTYYYDPKTGLMVKGSVTIEGRTYWFDETTGALAK